jgi:hypothetical protein
MTPISMNERTVPQAHPQVADCATSPGAMQPVVSASRASAI